jgi:two-component system sensor histidine kinase CiaH
VISIILENAFKYVKSGKVEMDLTMSDKEMVATITDTGPGISDDEKKKVFERFFRSRDAEKVRKQKGLGLGLYIAKKITDKLKGTIELVDNPDATGSRFIIKFPVYKKQ